METNNVETMETMETNVAEVENTAVEQIPETKAETPETNPTVYFGAGMVVGMLGTVLAGVGFKLGKAFLERRRAKKQAEKEAAEQEVVEEEEYVEA